MSSGLHRGRAAAIAAVGVLAAGCGSVPGGSGPPCVGASCVVTTASPAPSPSASGGSASAHGWTTRVAISVNHVDVSVTVSGPLSVEAGCVPPLAVWLVGADGGRLDPSPTPGLRCQAIAIEDIPAGQVRDYPATLPPPSPGTYTVHGLVRVHLPIGAGARVSENIPVVTLTVP
jgi:hypothetical protein